MLISVLVLSWLDESWYSVHRLQVLHHSHKKSYTSDFLFVISLQPTFHFHNLPIPYFNLSWPRPPPSAASSIASTALLHSAWVWPTSPEHSHILSLLDSVAPFADQTSQTCDAKPVRNVARQVSSEGASVWWQCAGLKGTWTMMWSDLCS